MYTIFGCYCDSVPLICDVKIKDEKLKRAESFKYLGIYINYNHKSDVHIEYVINRTKYLICVFTNYQK